MRGEQDGGKIGQAYQDHRPYPVDLAFRMLEDIGAAETSSRTRSPACALLVVLQQLNPERVVFVQHDIFQMPFDIVAETAGEKFIATWSNGDLSGLLDVLAPDAWVRC